MRTILEFWPGLQIWKLLMAIWTSKLCIWCYLENFFLWRLSSIYIMSCPRLEFISFLLAKTSPEVSVRISQTNTQFSTSGICVCVAEGAELYACVSVRPCVSVSDWVYVRHEHHYYNYHQIVWSQLSPILVSNKISCLPEAEEKLLYKLSPGSVPNIRSKVD